MSSRFTSRFFLLPLVGVALFVSAMSGCSLFKKQAVAPPTPKPTPAGPQPPKIDFAAIRPNELGAIPVVMYHEIKGTESKPKKLIRSIADFKQDLEILYKAGYRPVNLSDVVNNHIDVPAGMSPVALTFDDARASQFRLVEKPNAMEIDPDCAVGILEAFHKAHADWPMRATFFILPKSKATLEPFGQLGLGGQKLEYITSQGMEIGNHTVTHKSLRNMTAAQIQAEVGGANKSILAAAPNAKITVFAAPMGLFPKDKKLWPLLVKGEFEGVPYDYAAAFTAAWRPMPAAASKKYNPARLERVDSTNEVNGMRDWITKLGNGSAGMPRYVSDGDPEVISYPKGSEELVNLDKIKAEGKLAYAYSPFGGAGGAKPIVGTSRPTPGATITEQPPAAAPKKIIGAAQAPGVKGG